MAYFKGFRAGSLFYLKQTCHAGNKPQEVMNNIFWRGKSKEAQCHIW